MSTPDPRLPDPGSEPDPPGGLRLTDPKSLLVLATVGLVNGWTLRPLTRALGWSTPTVSWLHVLGLLLATAIVAGTARRTRRALRRRTGELRPHEAVNRLLLGKACALVGALAAGGYAGSALSWVGAASVLSTQYSVRALVAAVVSAGLSAAGLWLERACRVDDDPPAA